MERVGFLLKVREEMVEEYKNHHRAVWPDMLDALRRNGWRNYSLFMADDGTFCSGTSRRTKAFRRVWTA